MSRGRLLAVGFTVAFALHAGAVPSGAADLTTAGWWWRAQTGTVGLPPPPHVPANGLAVGNAPDGPSAVGALRFSLQADEIDPVLTLAVAEVFAGGSIGLVACPAAAPWFGVQAGTWDERPEAACAVGTVDGVEAVDGSSWTFPLTGLFGDGLLDVVILPAEDSDPFEMSFEAPTGESLRTTRAATPSDFDPGFDSTGFDGEESFVPPSGGFTGTDFGRPFDPVTPPPAAPGAAPADASLSEQPRRFVPVARGAGSRPEDDADPRALALVILLAALAVAVALGREALPAPRLLGPMAQRRASDLEEHEARGLGRFRRPRHGDAPSLH